MKFLRGVYDFVTGGSLASPAGLIAAVLAAYLCVRLGAGSQAAAFTFLAILGLTLVTSVLEGAR